MGRVLDAQESFTFQSWWVSNCWSICIAKAGYFLVYFEKKVLLTTSCHKFQTDRCFKGVCDYFMTGPIRNNPGKMFQKCCVLKPLTTSILALLLSSFLSDFLCLCVSFNSHFLGKASYHDNLNWSLDLSLFLKNLNSCTIRLKYLCLLSLIASVRLKITLVTDQCKKWWKPANWLLRNHLRWRLCGKYQNSKLTILAIH